MLDALDWSALDRDFVTRFERDRTLLRIAGKVREQRRIRAGKPSADRDCMHGPKWVALLAGMSAFAADAPVVDEFRFMGGSLACVMAPGSTAKGYDPCLRIGKVRVGGDYSEIVKKFGEPNQTDPVDEGRGQARMYVFDSDPKALTYISVWEANGKIIAVQMTGTKPDMPTFAGVTLGDDTQKLKAKLGPASGIRSAKGYDLWSYQPFPFSIEVRDGRVYSIKVWRALVRGPCACGKPGCCSTNP